MLGKAFQTIFVRLLAGVLGLVLLAVGPAAYLTFQSYRDALARHYLQEVDAVAQGLASAAFNAAAARDLPTLQGIVGEMASNTPADVALVVDRNGRIWAHSDPGQFGAAFVSFSALEWVATGVDIEAGGRVLGTAYAAIHRDRLEAESSRPLRLVGLGFAVALVLASGLAVFFSLSTARPIGRLTRAAREMADGRFDQPLGDIKGPIEVRAMARTFEEMRQSLERTLAQRNESYRLLDRKVRELTVLYGVSEAMNGGDYSEGLLDTILVRTVKGLRARFGALWIVEPEAQDGSRLVATTGLVRRGAKGPLHVSIEAAGKAAMKNGSAALGECPAESGETGRIHIAAQPLQVQDESAGALVVARSGAPFADEDLALLDALASHAARCVERSQLHEAAIKDGLTGLYVSRHFRQRLKDELRTAARYQRKLAVVMVDIDHFKNVNDTYGHQAGDEVLRGVALCLLDAVRDGVDIAARYGGEEFALILPETDREGAWSLAERVRQLVAAQQIVYGDAVLRVTASLGVATFPEQGERPQALVEAADQALYRAKRNGRNRVEVAGD